MLAMEFRRHNIASNAWIWIEMKFREIIKTTNNNIHTSYCNRLATRLRRLEQKNQNENTLLLHDHHCCRIQ